MAARTQDLARLIVDRYDGNPAQLWASAATGQELVRRIAGLPGFGATKAQIFAALLAKQLGELRRRLAGGHRPVRRGRLPGLGGRHHRLGLPGRGPRLQAAQGRRQGGPVMTAQVFVLHEGYAREEDGADRVGSTVTLIVDGGRVIVVTRAWCPAGTPCSAPSPAGARPRPG